MGCREAGAKRELREASLRELLTRYSLRHLACTDDSKIMGPYVVMRASNTAAGIGNLLPGVITGTIPGNGYLLTLFTDGVMLQSQEPVWFCNMY